MSLPLADWFERLGRVDPAPFFVLSLLPYLAFLWWAQKVRAFPRLALRGFQLTLLFVAVTIAAAVVAQLAYGRQLADVDPLHGGAEAFLTLSNLVVLLGFRPSQAEGLQADAAAAVPPPAEGQEPPEAPR
ncbi:DUF3593 domain-containing protein [Synechococcus sp. BA-132 BA5]|uniref:DUF3593 domain-containing protein n=1 Tax=Synechococcus sp. BA-132 BA5 TaxID=3110252 RepID=UPI002B1FA29C|nr:DUF3593 domain-containing protein [Synechococcus sp. BA-132 BA5]MEA5415907.1 DUF3593 domain-containing protein [Synechococcus sp. BA-132 BA5]